jgi:hypothetical protein
MRVAGKVTQDVCYERFMYPQGAMRDSISMSQFFRILDTEKGERCLMADSDQNEPENNKNDKNELPSGHLADAVGGVVAVHQPDGSASEVEMGSLFEPSGNTEIQLQEAVPAKARWLSEAIAELELPPQEAVHAQSDVLSEPSTVTGIQSQGAVDADDESID